MGTPLPANEPTTDCPTCWGPGKPFGPGPTPHIVQVRLTSMRPGEFFTEASEQFLLTTHHLISTIGTCNWQLEASAFRFILDYLGPTSILLVSHLPTAHGVFDNTLAPLCSADIPNLLVNPAGTIMFGGFANITWDLEGL